MSALEVIEKATLIINSMLLLLLGMRHLQEIRRSRAQSEKLELELEALKRETRAANQRIVRPSDNDLEKLVVAPITQRLDHMSRYLPSVRSAASADHEVAAAVEQTLQSLNANTERVTASQEAFLRHQERLFRDASAWIREAIADGLKDVRLELRVNSDRP
jgi:hypothetical protein